MTIYERFDEPGPVGSGFMLQPTGLAVLDKLGLRESIEQLGARIDRIHGTEASSGRAVLDVRYDWLGPDIYGLAVQRTALFNVLWSAVQAENIAVETGFEAMDIDHRSKPVLVDVNGRKSASHDLIIDASGACSRLIGHAMVPSSPKTLAFGALWATTPWHGKGFDQHALLQRYRRSDVMIGVLPVGTVVSGDQAKATFFWSVRGDALADLRTKGIAAWRDEVAGYWPEAQVYADGISSFDEMAFARYGHHTLVVPAGRNTAFIGDCAHSTSPQLGQGVNMALLDAYALARALDQEDTIADTLEYYAGLRRLHVRTFQSLSWMFTPFYQSQSHLLPVIRDHLAARIATIRPFRRLLAHMVAGTLVRPIRRHHIESGV